jgi:hypothetical protein
MRALRAGMGQSSSDWITKAGVADALSIATNAVAKLAGKTDGTPGPVRASAIHSG